MELNMPDIAGPIGLLKCVAALGQLQTGDVLAVSVLDADVYAALVKIFGNDGGCRVFLEETAEGHRMVVTKI